MTRLGTVLASGCLGAFLLVTSGCEDKQCQDSLSSCRTEVSNLQKMSETQQTAMRELREQLTQAQAKVQELTAQLEPQKGGKGTKAKEEKGKTAEEKAPSPAKAEEKAAAPAKAEAKEEKGKTAEKPAAPAKEEAKEEKGKATAEKPAPVKPEKPAPVKAETKEKKEEKK
jgi:TolA-binding protein